MTPNRAADLIDMLRRLTRPSPSVDNFIDAAVGRRAPLGKSTDARLLAEELADVPISIGADCPAYTSSVDEAATLVPAGCSWAVAKYPKDSFATVSNVRDNFENIKSGHRGATPAIALCIAALYAAIYLARKD